VGTSETEPVAELEGRILPLLRTVAIDLRREFPNTNVGVESHPVGRLTSLQGHIVAITVMLSAPDQRPDQPDHVDLVVGLRHLSSAPELDTADVCWGHPSGHTECDLLSGPMPVDEAVWQLVESGLPRLIAALRDAIRRGQPPADATPFFPY